MQAYDFILGREPDRLPNCGTWYVSGTVYNNGSGSQRLNGVPVRIWAYGIEQGTDTTGVHGGRTGYWEWVFGKGSNVDGEVAVVNPDGSLRSPRIPFNLQSACNDNNVNQVVIDFVGTH